MALTDQDAFTAGPGDPPDPWRISGGTAAYDGSILLPTNVTGGSKGPGTINTNALYIQGTNLTTILGTYLPLAGGTVNGALYLNGILYISNTSNIRFSDSLTAGQIITSDGLGGTYWASPGGPYLPLIGGTLTGPLVAGLTNLKFNGGTTGQVLSTNGSGVLSWANASTTISLPTGSPVGYLLATDSASNPYWTNILPGGPYAPAVTGGYTPLSGGTMTGLLTLFAAPTANLGAATKSYVDTQTNTVLDMGAF